LWIASDIHLGPDSPATAAAFKGFLKQAAQQADTLILAGDIFDAWVGDDVALHSTEPWLRDAVSALRETATRIPVWLGRGNRDFLIGNTLARHIGARLLPEPALLSTDAGLILLAHGDEYCVADASYQRFRQVVRHAGVQALYLSLPLNWRKGIAAWARRRSQQGNQYKSREIMDVDTHAVAEALRASGAHTLVHGHTHRPARNPLCVDGIDRERLVIPDWDFDHCNAPRGGWVSVGKDGIHIMDVVTGAVAKEDQASK
jgi:UDP-2,3-diacylglucosamine hydrolase